MTTTTMPTVNDIQTREARHILQLYRRAPVTFVRGRGVRLYDADDREYIDLLSGIGVASLGHAHPGLAHAVAVRIPPALPLEHRARLRRVIRGERPGRVVGPQALLDGVVALHSETGVHRSPEGVGRVVDDSVGDARSGLPLPSLRRCRGRPGSWFRPCVG